MTAIVEGLYKQGKIELVQGPANAPEGRVRVILIAEDRPKVPPRLLTFGKYPGDTSTLEDFQGAQWYGEREFDPPHGQ
jgi:hypothetical protein